MLHFQYVVGRFPLYLIVTLSVCNARWSASSWPDRPVFASYILTSFCVSLYHTSSLPTQRSVIVMKYPRFPWSTSPYRFVSSFDFFVNCLFSCMLSPQLMQCVDIDLFICPHLHCVFIALIVKNKYCDYPTDLLASLLSCSSAFFLLDDYIITIVLHNATHFYTKK